MEEVLGKYNVVGRLGIGGMADVYLCRLIGIGGFDKHVVVKRIRADIANNYEFVEMFLDEARLAANLTHPNIVQIFEIDMLDGLPYMAMEYVAGKTLATLTRELRTQGMDFGNLAHVMAEVCAGLHHAHNARDASGNSLHIVHRDISPQNIIVSIDGIAKVFDFGVAKAMGRLGATDAGTVKGKVAYMAPEQLRARPVDGRADVYAVGVCLYEATVGDRPFKGFTEGELFAARVEGAFALPSAVVPDYPLELERIVLSAMAPEPDDRPDAASLGDALRAFALAAGRSTETVATWMATLFPEDAPQVPLARRSGKLLAATGSSPEAVTVSSGSQASRARAATPAPGRSGVRIAALVIAALVAGAAIAFVALAPPSRSDSSPAVATGAGTDAAGPIVPLVTSEVDAAPPAVVASDATPLVATSVSTKDVSTKDVSTKDVPKKDVPKKDVPKKDVPKKDLPAAGSGSASAAAAPAIAPRVTTTPPTPLVTTPPSTTPPATTPPATTPPATAPTASTAIAAPRLPATFSARNVKEIGKVLDVIEGEAIKRGKAPASIRGVTQKLAEEAYAEFVPGDFVELHPREMYYLIVRGVRAGKSKSAIASELKGTL